MRRGQKIRLCEEIYIFSNRIANIIVLCVYSLLAVASLFFTTYFVENRVETVAYKTDMFLANIIILIFIFILIGVVLNKVDIDKIDIAKMELIVLIIVMIVGMIWISMVQSKPFADGKVISDAVKSIKQSDYSFLEKEEYFGKFPFQLWLLEIFKGLYWFAGEDNFIFLQILNVIALIVTYHFIFLTSEMILKSKKVLIVLIGLLLMCFPVILYCSFIYGTMYGFALSTGSIYCVIKYLEQQRQRYILFSIPLMVLAILIKNNYLIVFLALSIVLFLEWLKSEKRYIMPLLFIVSVLIINSVSNVAIQKKYEQESGIEIHTGIPSIAWIAMGMQNGNKGPGWYNRSMFEMYESVGCDTEETARESKMLISKMIDSYLENPKQFIEFYAKKIISQWNEPTFESLWVSEHAKNTDMHSNELSEITEGIYHRKLNILYLSYCNIYHLLIFVSAAICFAVKWKKLNLKQDIFMIVVLGGFFFHILWEANSKYIITYFVYILPYAAIGIVVITDWIQHVIHRIKGIIKL